jgi:hypothetical protein
MIEFKSAVEYPSPDWVIDKIAKEREVRSWCVEHFPKGNYQVFQNRVYFENEKDATLFALRWA